MTSTSPERYEETALGSPDLCGGCGHTLHEGDLVHRRRGETDTGSTSGVRHSPRCPALLEVMPCPPCLYALLAGDVEEPHDCDLTTVAAVDGVQLLVGREADCPCGCRRMWAGPSPSPERMTMTMTVPDPPPRCILCGHTIRPGEPTEEQTLGADSGPHHVGVAHLCCCPDLLSVPCAPCLRAILTKSNGPHECMEVTSLSISGHWISVDGEETCPCDCTPPRAGESDALAAARAQARGLVRDE